MPKKFVPRTEPTREQRRQAWLDQLRLHVSERMAKALRGTPEDIVAAVTELETLVDGNLIRLEATADRLRTQGHLIPHIACKKGCSYCCCIRVTASVPEVLRVAKYLREQRSDEERKAFLERAHAYLDAMRDLDGEAKSLLAYPSIFLDAEGACSIHPIRPIACRRHHSLDVEVCKRAAKDLGNVAVPKNLEHMTVTQPVVDGIDQATLRTGRNPRRVELIGALVLLLETDAYDQWLEGKDAFAEADANYLLEIGRREARKSH